MAHATGGEAKPGIGVERSLIVGGNTTMVAAGKSPFHIATPSSTSTPVNHATPGSTYTLPLRGPRLSNSMVTPPAALI